MARQEFKTESKRILDLMINSIYMHKEIFLRELISNASDAIDKLYYRSLQDGIAGMNRDDFQIHISLDKENRLLTITDNGCGMTRAELEENLGTIANSGTLKFRKENTLDEETDVIGQFGVGFYSAFMVSSAVTVKSRAYDSQEAWQWYSQGADGFEIESCDMDQHGTIITLQIMESTEEENYDKFLDPFRVSDLVKKYSDYIRYPIRMEVPRSRLKEGSDTERETVMEMQTLNSMIPIWKRSKGEVEQQEYDAFYQDKFFDFQPPLATIRSSAEGTVSYQTLLFVPQNAPADFYTKDFQKGLQLYASGVMIMERCSDLLPDCFGFVRGVVDSPDLSLNISREMLQHNRQLKVIAGNLEKKIKNELLSMQKNDREKYTKLFASFGLQLKYSIYREYGMNRDLLQDLLVFHSMLQEKMISFAEYRAAMPEEQKYIYYACGDTIAHIGQMPQLERLKEKGYDVLFLTEDVDEFILRILNEFDSKQFRSVSGADLGLESEEEKETVKEQNEQYKDVLAYMGECLQGEVKEVCISQRLKNYPVCITANGPVSIEMEKTLRMMNPDGDIHADLALELNPGHPVFQTLCDLYETDKEKLSDYMQLLYIQAKLIEGIPPEDPAAYTEAICNLMLQVK